MMCKYLHMATNLALDDQLIEDARRAGCHKSKREAVTAALEEYVRKRQQMSILEAFGTFPVDSKSIDTAYDYKSERRRGPSRPAGKKLRRRQQQ
jgi:hypothetical protein